MNETQSLECKYEIVMPYAVRGLLILMMNDNFDKEEYVNELRKIVQ